LNDNLPQRLSRPLDSPGLALAAASAHAFELPVPAEGFSISLMWHSPAEADPARSWLRELIAAACRERMPL
jgi:hypothetical protein